MLTKNMSLVLGLRRICLPVIQEEEGITNEENLDLSNFSLRKKYQDRKTLKIITCKNKPEKKENERKQSKAPPVKLPPLLNGNYLKNSDIKQSPPTWNANFRKQSSSRKFIDENKIPAKIKENHSPDLKKLKKITGKLEDGQTLRPIRSFANTTSTHLRNIKNVGGGNSVFSTLRKQTPPEKTKKKAKKINKKNPNTLKNEKLVGLINVKTQVETESKTRTKSYDNVEAFIEDLQANRETPAVSFFSRNQKMLSDCVKSALENDLNTITCEYCEETFTNIEELLTHKEKHEKEKEVCLLCDRVFCNPNDFINHLLTHDGIDRFNCEKCRKSFPSGKKYREHYKEFHVMNPENTTLQPLNSENIDFAKNLPPKHEYRECEKN